MKKTITLFLVLTLFTPLSIFAQKIHPSLACGTSYEDLHAIYETMQENRARYPNNVQMRAVAYIPVALHLAAKSDGTGRLPECRILEYMANVNATYAANGLEMQFYIKYINYINDDNFYTKPSSFASINRTYTYKKKDALNIFFCNDLGDGTDPNSVRLGYYARTASANDLSYGADWVFIKNSEVLNGVSSTLEHELGHFFSLAHTFSGWECDQFKPTAVSPCAPKTVACSGAAVENAARTGSDANCSTAADGFCDTPADYNFGFGWNDCNYKSVAKDPLCVAVDPDETNLMGYFTANCSTKFSTEQKNAIRKDYLNNSFRAYLRAGDKVPAGVDATAPTMQIPANGGTTTSYSNLNFDWTDSNGVVNYEPNNASGYVFEIGTFPSLTVSYSFKAPASSFNLLSNMLPAGYLQPNKKYYWRVSPYGAYKSICGTGTTSSFTTGTLNAVSDISSVENFTVSPNPVVATKTIDISLTSAKQLNAFVKINNLAGQVVLSEKMRFETGINTKSLNINALSKGLYILTIEAENGVLNKKLVVAE